MKDPGISPKNGRDLLRNFGDTKSSLKKNARSGEKKTQKTEKPASRDVFTRAWVPLKKKVP